MDPLELSYDSIDSVPEAFRPLYSESNGKAVLSGVNGMKTPQDVANVQEALRKEREDHRAAQEALKPWKNMKYEDVQAQLDRIPGLEAASKGQIDESKIEEIINQRKPQIVGPLERQLNETNETNATLIKENEQLKQSIATRDRNEAVRKVAREMKVVDSAIADIELVAGMYLENTDGGFMVKADATDITPGLDIKGFLKEMQKLRPHWWPASEGGGAGGGDKNGLNGPNPWSAESWNMGKQVEVLRGQGREAADRLAAAAGTTVGGLKPQAKK